MLSSASAPVWWGRKALWCHYIVYGRKKLGTTLKSVISRLIHCNGGELSGGNRQLILDKGRRTIGVTLFLPWQLPVCLIKYDKFTTCIPVGTNQCPDAESIIQKYDRGVSNWHIVHYWFPNYAAWTQNDFHSSMVEVITSCFCNVLLTVEVSIRYICYGEIILPIPKLFVPYRSGWWQSQFFS